MLAIFGVSLTFVLSLPKNADHPGAAQVMYSSVFHSDGSNPDSVKIAQKPATVKETAKPVVKPSSTKSVETETSVTEETEDVCGFPDVEYATADYDAKVIAVRKQFRHEESQEFRVKIFVKNSGNMPWFSPDSKCLGARVYIGTTRDEGRESMFVDPTINKEDNSAISKSVIRMDSGKMRVDPGEIASFTFWGKADSEPSVYREFFAPYMEGSNDIFRDAEFKVDFYTGVTNESASDLRTKLLFAETSMRVNDMAIEGKRSAEVDLSDQKLWLKLDDTIVREFRVSTGAKATPTPLGTFKILLKNEVRIGRAKPHYIMPRFQMFTPQGAALHALPSLGNDGGVFWTEARDHIGTPVSHGCVRMLPEDADFAYEFLSVGDSIYIHW